MAEKECIERQAAIAVIEEKQKELCPVGMYSRHAVYGSDRERFDAWQEIIDMLESIPAADAIEELSKPRWIPVTERLPEEMDRLCGGWSAEIRPSDDVLVWLSSEKRQSVAWYSHTYNEWTTVDENTVYCFEEVTHWQPLPQPPKEENK